MAYYTMKININFKNQPQGNYQVKLFNKLGQAVYNGSITISSINQVASIKLPAGLTSGIYQLTLSAEKAKAIIK